MNTNNHTRTEGTKLEMNKKRLLNMLTFSSQLFVKKRCSGVFYQIAHLLGTQVKRCIELNQANPCRTSASLLQKKENHITQVIYFNNKKRNQLCFIFIYLTFLLFNCSTSKSIIPLYYEK